MRTSHSLCPLGPDAYGITVCHMDGPHGAEVSVAHSTSNPIAASEKGCLALPPSSPAPPAPPPSLCTAVVVAGTMGICPAGFHGSSSGVCYGQERCAIPEQVARGPP